MQNEVKVIVSVNLLEEVLDVVASNVPFLTKTQAALKLMQSLERVTAPQEDPKMEVKAEEVGK